MSSEYNRVGFLLWPPLTDDRAFLHFEFSRHYFSTPNIIHKRQVTHLDGHGAHDGPLVPLERLERHLRDLLVRLAQELLARRQQHLLVLTLDLDLLRAADSNVSSALDKLIINYFI